MTTPNDMSDDDDAPMICPRTGMYCNADEPGFDCEAYGCAREAGLSIPADRDGIT